VQPEYRQQFFILWFFNLYRVCGLAILELDNQFNNRGQCECLGPSVGIRA